MRPTSDIWRHSLALLFLYPPVDTGAICAYSNSTVLVLGETYWAYNDAARNDESGGGAIYFSGSSLLSIEGTASMWRNVAVAGGAIFWRGESFFNVTGDGEVEFYENGARFGGAIAGRSDNMEEPVLFCLWQAELRSSTTQQDKAGEPWACCSKGA